jgi:hypothetical protein
MCYIDYGIQAVSLDGNTSIVEIHEARTNDGIKDWISTLVDDDANVVALPLQFLFVLGITSEYKLKSSFYAKHLKEIGLDIIACVSDRTASNTIISRKSSYQLFRFLVFTNAICKIICIAISFLVLESIMKHA